MSANLSKGPTILNIKEIREILPHRYPFLFVDRVIDLDLENNSITAIKSLSMNEEFFQGHFPETPIMPGVLILEALAQTGGILIYKKGFKEKTAVLLSVNRAKFRRPALPGDVIHLHAHGVHFSANGGKVTAKATINDQLVAEADIGFALRSFEQI